MDLIEKYMTELNRQLNEEMEHTVLNYLVQHGYLANNSASIQDIIALEKRLEEQGKCIRCEYFVKFEPKTYTAKSVFIPFIDNIDYALDREEIYKMFKLDKQGYYL